MFKDAYISQDGLYRYWLIREWGAADKTVCFIMLNPSTADATEDDPTIRRCIGFAKAWGYGRLVVVNLFALRSTDPAKLLAPGDPIGSENDFQIYCCAQDCAAVVCAWGAHPAARGRDAAVIRQVRMTSTTLHYLKLTAGGAPSHPLYLKSSLTPKVWA